MGEGNSKQQQPVQKPIDPMDQLIDMKMTIKSFERESNKAMKEKEKLLAKARQALAKNNEEGARLFLQQAQMQQNNSIKMQQMSARLDNIYSQVKTNIKQQESVQMMSKLTPYLQHHSQQLPIEQIYTQLTDFDKAMEEIQVQHKIVDQMVSDPLAGSNDMMVENMFQQLKNEQNNQILNNLGQQENLQYKEPNLINNQQQYNQPNQQLYQQK